MSVGSGHKRRAIKEVEGSPDSRGKRRKPSPDNMFNSNDDIPMFRAIIKTTDAGAIIGKRGENIKRLRDEYSVNMSIPDSKSPERVLMIKGEIDKICQIILEILPCFEDYKNHEDLNFDAELRMLVIAGYVGAIMGSAGAKIKSLREDTGASVKVYEDCCPYSQERVFRINGTPNVLVEVVKRVLEGVQESSASRPQKDPVYYDPNKTASPDFADSDLHSRMTGSFGSGRHSSGGGGGGGGGHSGSSGGNSGRHYGSSYGSGDVGFRDGGGGHGGRGRASSGGGSMGSGGGRNGAHRMPAVDMMDTNMSVGGFGGNMNDYGSGGGAVGGGHFVHPYGGDGGAAPYRHPPEYSLDPSDEPVTMKVSIKHEDAGAVIGPKGGTINRVRERSGCNIKIDDGRGPESIRGQRIITITGTDQQIKFAQYLMQQSVKQDQNRQLAQQEQQRNRSGGPQGQGQGNNNRR